MSGKFDIESKEDTFFVEQYELPSPEGYSAFWSKTSDNLHWSPFSLDRHVVTQLDLLPNLTFSPNSYIFL